MGEANRRSHLIMPGPSRNTTATEVGAQALQRIAVQGQLALLAERSMTMATLALRIIEGQNVPMLKGVHAEGATPEMHDDAPKALDAAIALAGALMDACDQAVMARVTAQQAPPEGEEPTELEESPN